VSYITRLREQSRLAIVNEAVSKRSNVPVPAAGAASPAIELIEVDETREVASDGAPAMDIVSLLPASVPTGMAESARRQYVEPVADLPAVSPNPGEAARSASRASTVGETSSAPRSEGAGVTSSRQAEPLETAPLSRDATLRHVFEWLGKPGPAVESRDGAFESRREPVRGTPLTPTSIETVAMSRPAPVPASARERVRPPSPIDGHHEDLVELSNESRRVLPAIASPAPESAIEERVEEILTVSIGAIHMRVEAQATAPVVAARPADRDRTPRPERRERSRLPRHYLRP
jgi:hypothetical protein